MVKRSTKDESIFSLSDEEIAALDPHTEMHVNKVLGIGANYFEENGYVFRYSANGNQVLLANFTTKPVAIVTHDSDGSSIKYYRLCGKMFNGERLDTIEVLSEEFDAMKWIRKYWNLAPRINTTLTSINQYRDYIQSQAETLPIHTVYTHCGFRKINKKLIYLYNEGAIEGNHISCKLDSALSNYQLCDSSNTTPTEAFTFILNKLLNLTDDKIVLPLIAFYFLAPLTYFLKIAHHEPCFALYIRGETGSFKTSLALLMLSCFRKDSAHSAAPTNFESTSNAIEKYQYDLKDMVLVIDDYHPTITSKKDMDEKVQRIARGSGDHAARQRLNSDSSIKKSYVPRGLTVITGEDTPDISVSGLARLFFIDLKKGDIDKSKLTKVQEKSDLLNIAMHYYIKFLIENAEELPLQLESMFVERQQMVSIPEQHNRTGSNLAWLYCGINIFYDCLVHYGLKTSNEVKNEKAYAWDLFLHSAIDQTKELFVEDPCQKFLDAITEMIDMKQKTLLTINSDNSITIDIFATKDNIVGWKDDEFFYFKKKTIYAAVREFYRKSGGDFPVSETRLYQDLHKRKIISGQPSQGYEFVKPIEGKCTRTIRIEQSIFRLQTKDIF